MTFDPDTIELPQEFHERMDKSQWSSRQREILAARRGAALAVKALRHQWPDPITDRPPTKDDADDLGNVQVRFGDGWALRNWETAVKRGVNWLHTLNWRPKPEPTEKEQALKLVEKVGHELEDPECALLCRVLQSAPDATP